MLLPVNAPLPLKDSQPLPFAHREPYAAYFGRLARGPDTAAALRRLIPHLDADLDGSERLALWQALWHCAQTLDRTSFDAVARCLDGRFAVRLQALQRCWHDPSLIEHLAACTRPAAARAAFVPTLLAHHGLDPLTRPESHAPGLVLMAVAAALHDAAPRLQADRIAQLQQATLQAAEQGTAWLAPGLALLFELALHAAEEDTATAVLAELLQHGHAGLLRTDRVRAWLDGTAFNDDANQARPLLLAPALQQQWLQPTQWTERPALQALCDAVQRPDVKARLTALDRGLHADASAASAPAEAALPLNEGLQGLRALDTAWLLVDRGGDAVPAMQQLMQPDTLAAPALAALHLGSARWHAQQGDLEGQVLALLQSRRHQATPVLRQSLAQLLPAPTPAFGADWREEEPYWTRLLAHGDPIWQRLAAFQLATLYTNGLLEPRPPRRCQDLRRAQALWTQLAPEARYANIAHQMLRQPAQTLLRPALQQHRDLAYLWIDCPGAQAVTVIFSCIATHHSFADVAALRGRLPGQHLMFVRCPDKDWYSDSSFDALRDLLRIQVQTRFARDQVTCFYGSMGGHGALKFALEFGWRAVVFNPQTDLDLWAAFRPRERALLWGAERHARLRDWPRAAWEQAPLYLACGAATADREGLSVLIDRLRRCNHATAIVEKFDDHNHAGLWQRIHGSAVGPALARVTRRLKALEAAQPAPGSAALDGRAQANFWTQLDEARELRVELQVRQGRLWWQPSAAGARQSRVCDREASRSAPPSDAMLCAFRAPAGSALG